MNNNIFIPKKINVGFQERSSTYTKKLAYIIYFDEKGALRKERSWNSWRDDKIEPIMCDNVPTSGFVLNKKTGGYSTGWNHRQSYIRVYDPRDFEFEITVENLLYILENTNSIKGKGLEGEFVYGWSGKDLILIPTESPDYIEITKFNEVLHANNKIKAKDLILGATYKTKQNEEYVYMGKFDYHSYRSNGKKQFWFYNNANERFTQFTTLSDKLIQVIDSNCCSNYAELFDMLECKTEYSPIDETKDEYEFYNLDCFTEMIDGKILQRDYYWAKLNIYCDLEDNQKALVSISRKGNMDSFLLKATKKSIKMEKYISWSRYEREREVEYEEILCESTNIEEIFNQLKPQYKNIYLKNGKLKGGYKNNEQY